MKTAVFYCSRHHGNTRRVLEAMALEGCVDLLDVTGCRTVPSETYDCIGLASGIYFGSYHKSLLQFARQHLPQGTPVFFVHTYGMLRPGYTKAAERLAREKGCPVLGTFGCRGWDTFGPFRLVGGIAKGRPDGRDLARARSFYRNLAQILREVQG